MSKKDEYPKEHKYGDPYYCYVCDHLTDISDSRAIFDVSECVYHIVHYRCRDYYFRGHTWKGRKTLEEIYDITRRYYYDQIIYFDWLI